MIDNGSSRAAVPEFVPALRFRALTPFYDLVMRFVMHEDLLRARLIGLLRLRTGDSALDVGCGTGTLVIQMKRTEPGASVVALDADPDALRIAAAKARGAGVTAVFERGSAERLPCGDGSIDVVVSSLAFHHLGRNAKRSALAETFRVLRLGGRLCIADFGAPRTRLGYVATLPLQILDGRTNANDNFRGRLPSMIHAAGFCHVIEVSRLRTVVGPVCFYSGIKPEPES